MTPLTNEFAHGLSVNNVKNLMGSFKDFHFFVEMECMLHSNEKMTKFFAELFLYE